LLSFVLSSLIGFAQTQPEISGTIVFVHNGALFTKALPDGKPLEISRGAEAPKFAPSGEWISYIIPRGGNRLLIVRSIKGPGSILSLQTTGHAAWSPSKDELAFPLDDALRVIRPDRNGGNSDHRLVFRANTGDTISSFCWSVDGSHVAIVSGHDQMVHLWSVDAESGDAREIDVQGSDRSNVIGGATLAGWSVDGQHIFLWSNP